MVLGGGGVGGWCDGFCGVERRERSICELISMRKYMEMDAQTVISKRYYSRYIS